MRVKLSTRSLRGGHQQGKGRQNGNMVLGIWIGQFATSQHHTWFCCTAAGGLACSAACQHVLLRVCFGTPRSGMQANVVWQSQSHRTASELYS
jgi:hypothetical protein